MSCCLTFITLLLSVCRWLPRYLNVPARVLIKGEVAAHQKVFLAIQFVYLILPGVLRSVPDLTNVFLTSSHRK
jgi:hypothetical protein